MSKRTSLRAEAHERMTVNLQRERDFRAKHRSTTGWGIRRTERAIEAGLHILNPSSHQRELQRKWGFRS